MKIIQEARQIVDVSYSRAFEFVGQAGSGFRFTCDEDGDVDVPSLSEAAKKNFAKCLSNSHSSPVVDLGIERYENSWREPKIGECDDCGRHISLGSFTNTCDCGADYNSSGQRLASRSQWGEETGEHWTDCI